MRNYVVGILSMFENDLKLFKITAESEYEAVKKAMIEFCDDEDAKMCEIDWQNSDYYPKSIKEMINSYEDIPFNIIEI
mgnify:FL=1